MIRPTLACAVLLSVAFASAKAQADSVDLPCFGQVRIVDSADCTKLDHGFEEFPHGASRVETVLGRPCRVLPVQDGKSSFVKWRLGEGKGVKPNTAYVVVIEYPDDGPRSYLVRNNGNNSRRSFHTGTAIGDAYDALYADHHPVSLKIPQSGRYELWTALTFPGEKAPTRDEKGRLDIAKDGFDVILAQFAKRHAPESLGVAATRILLCEIPDEKKLYLDLRLPPAPLPKRRIFWREEMSDGAAIEGDDPLVSANNGLDWFEQKARAMKIFGQNTFTKEMLEFGHNQHWECNWKHGKPGGRSWKWMWPSKGRTANVWNDVVPMVADKYGLDILPYYEYGGANGQLDKNDPKVSLGSQRRAEPLDIDNKPDRDKHGANYTHIWWSDGKLRVDITDPDTFDELCYVLEGTILRFSKQVQEGRFAGAWFRPRPGEWPVSFADATRARFAKEANGGKLVSRADLKRDKALYGKYIDWYGVKRAEFCERLRKYLEDNGVKGAIVLLDNEDSEVGPGLEGLWGVLTDDPGKWKSLVKPKHVIDIADPKLVSEHLCLKQRTTPSSTWGPWEWQHACPADDPQHYAKYFNVWLTMSFHKIFSVNDPAAFDAFRNGSGTDSLVRHYGLNENMIRDRDVNDKDGNAITGYAMADFERAGRACMMSEVHAMANGDPVNLGYLMGSNYTRGFPGPVREFNENFLALPALPSKVVEGACGDPEIVLREIDCTKYGKGRYYALVHTGMTPKAGVRVKFPAGAPSVERIVSGEKIQLRDGVLELKYVRPWQLVSFRR